jgi:uncharacterized surface protein with fasciclin (FAS1) repeats
MIKANVLPALSNPALKVTLFAPDNDAMALYGMRYTSDNDSYEIKDKDGLWREMTEEEILSFVQDHLLYSELSGVVPGSFIEMPSGNYITVFNATEFAAGGNIEVGDRVAITGEEPSGCDNGMLYYVDNVIKAPKKNLYNFIAEDPELSDFHELLVEADQVGTKPDPAMPDDTIFFIKFTEENDKWTAFVPTNEALASITIPRDFDNKPDTLTDFLKYHFVPGEVIFDDGQTSGTFPTPVIESTMGENTNYYTLDIINNKDALVVTDKTGMSVPVPHATANNLVQKGVLHKIKEALFFKQWN